VYGVALYAVALYAVALYGVAASAPVRLRRSPAPDRTRRYGCCVPSADEAAQRRLLATPERAAFVDAVVALAAERRLAVSPGDVEDALRAARRTWLERWV
jgi:hypothetical protein